MRFKTGRARLRSASKTKAQQGNLLKFSLETKKP